MTRTLSIALLLVAGCGGNVSPNDAATSNDAASSNDAATGHDAASSNDAASTNDAALDHDAALAHDAAMTVDAFRTFSDAGCATSPTFADVNTAIFSVSCSGPINCHSSSSFIPGGGLVLTDPGAYDALVSVPSTIDHTVLRVDPGSASTSLLFRKLTNDLPADNSLGSPMPSGEAIMWHELPPDQIELVRCWIATGASR